MGICSFLPTADFRKKYQLHPAKIIPQINNVIKQTDVHSKNPAGKYLQDFAMSVTDYAIII